jgi:hypothetical protein
VNGRLPRPVWIALAVGVIALLLSLLRLASSPEAFFRSYLPAWLFWIAIPVGSMAWLMIHRLTGGGWGVFARPVLAAGAGALPVNALLFLPLAFGLGHLYAWAGPQRAAAQLAGGKAVWLQPGFFLARETLVLVLWLGLAHVLGIWRETGHLQRPLPLGEGGDEGIKQGFISLNSKNPPSSPSFESSKRKSFFNSPHPNPPQSQTVVLGAPGRPFPEREGVKSALGLIVFGLTVTVFAIDWIMSLEPRWASTNIGFLAAASLLLLALAFGTSTLCLLAPERISKTSAARFGDLGGLLLAFVLLWSYLAFEQYLTIWAENLPDKAVWYVQRNADGWRGWSWTLAAVAGALPFFLLLSRDLKRDPRRLVWAVRLILAGGLLDIYWQTMPGFYGTPRLLSVLDLLPLIGIGGLWMAAYLWLLPRCLARQSVEEAAHGGE